MNKWEKEVQQSFLEDEKQVIETLEQVYHEALDEINLKIEGYVARIEAGDNVQSAIYQKQYQEQLKAQIEASLEVLHSRNYETISEYLEMSYENGYIGSFYDMQKQGVPLIIPFNEDEVLQATVLNSQISEPLYQKLGVDTAKLKRTIASEVSRGISTGASFNTIAKQIGVKSKVAYSNAARIARTEGHRVQCQSGFDAMRKAKEKGADVVKQWDSTLDGVTRPSHRALDHEVQELEDKFSNGLMYPGDPSGIAAEVCNCRCALTQRARWALGAGFSKMNNETGEIVDFSGVEDYNEFKKKFWEILDEHKLSVKSSNGLDVKSISTHTAERAKERGVSEENIKDALKNPLKIFDIVTDEKGRKSQRFIGESATVNVNPDTGVIATVWRTGKATKKKYMKGD